MPNRLLGGLPSAQPKGFEGGILYVAVVDLRIAERRKELRLADFGNESILPGFDEERGDHLNVFLERVAGDARCLIVHLGDRIDGYNHDYFQRAMGKLLAEGYRRLVFDCAELGFISASGMSSISTIGTRLAELGGAMAFARVRPRVLEVFEMLGLTGLHPFCEEVGKAISELSRVPRRDQAKKLSFTCPGCSRRLVAGHAGKFICATCKTRMIVDGEGMAHAC